MMTNYKKPLLVAALVLLCFSSASEARSRWSRFFFWRQDYDYQYDPGAYDDRYNDPYYNDPYPRRPPRQVRPPDVSYNDPYYNDPYYRDEPVRPVKPRKKAAAKPAKPKTATSQAAPSQTATAKATGETGAATSAPEKTKAAGGMSCERATDIVSSYGFTSVTASSCTGKVYAFNAVRGGKNFAVKLSAATGELTEVKKQ